MLYVDLEKRQTVVKLMTVAYNIKRLIKLDIKYTVITRQVKTMETA